MPNQKYNAVKFWSIDTLWQMRPCGQAMFRKISKACGRGVITISPWGRGGSTSGGSGIQGGGRRWPPCCTGRLPILRRPGVASAFCRGSTATTTMVWASHYQVRGRTRTDRRSGRPSDRLFEDVLRKGEKNPNWGEIRAISPIWMVPGWVRAGSSMGPGSRWNRI